MSIFGEKIKNARKNIEISQEELALRVGVSGRSIQAYELGEKKPRNKTLIKLAEVLGVSERYLSDDNCTDPTTDIEKDPYISEVRNKYGKRDADEVSRLLAGTTALFAGGTLSQEDKDKYFESIMKTYLACKEKAKEKYGKKSGSDE